VPFSETIVKEWEEKNLTGQIVLEWFVKFDGSGRMEDDGNALSEQFSVVLTDAESGQSDVSFDYLHLGQAVRSIRAKTVEDLPKLSRVKDESTQEGTSRLIWFF
jgi:hypothetical protein